VGKKRVGKNGIGIDEVELTPCLISVMCSSVTVEEA